MNSSPSPRPGATDVAAAVLLCPVCRAPARLFYRLNRLACKAWRCSGCGFVWIDPPLRTADAEYVDHYQQPAYAECVRVMDRAKYQHHLTNIQAAVDLRTAPNRRLLEVGSSYGHMLELLAEAGFTVEGIELLQAGVAASRARGLTIHSVPVEEFQSSEQFGVVLSTHVVEHLRDIQSYFRKTSELLAPGGFNILLTPNADATLFKLLRQFWTGATPDEHNLFLSFRAAELLGAQHGLELVAIKTTGRYWSTSRGILSELYHMRKAVRTGASTAQPTKPAVPAGPRRPGRRDAIFKLIERIESPFLTLLHKALARRGRSDELLAVFRKKSA